MHKKWANKYLKLQIGEKNEEINGYMKRFVKMLLTERIHVYIITNYTIFDKLIKGENSQ